MRNKRMGRKVKSSALPPILPDTLVHLTSQSYDKGYDPVTFITGSESGKTCPLHRFAPTTDSL